MMSIHNNCLHNEIGFMVFIATFNNISVISFFIMRSWTSKVVNPRVLARAKITSPGMTIWYSPHTKAITISLFCSNPWKGLFNTVSGVRRRVIKSARTGVFGFSLQGIGIPKFWKVWYMHSRNIYLRLLLISFNHVNNVMGVYTQSSYFKKFYLSGIIKLVYNCIQRELNISVNM
jgi:hypothetical protein